MDEYPRILRHFPRQMVKYYSTTQSNIQQTNLEDLERTKEIFRIRRVDGLSHTAKDSVTQRERFSNSKR
jgi:hypothetical protein